MKINKAISLLGLAQKAGKVASGEFSTEKAIKEGKAYLVIVSAEASENTIKKFKNMCEFYQVEVRFFGTKEELGHVIGKEFRASVAVTDEGFGKQLIKNIDMSHHMEV